MKKKRPCELPRELGKADFFGGVARCEEERFTP
jgi:hypothetical protein